MKDIYAWLQGNASYTEGVQLYLRYGSNPALKALFTKEDYSEFKLKKLKSALSELLQNDARPATPKAILQRQQEKAPISSQIGWPNPITNPVIQTLYDQWKPLYSEMINAQSRIYDVALAAEKGDPDKQLEACQLSHRILDLDDAVMKIYFQRDHYLLHGSLPNMEPEMEVVGDPVRWATELEKLKRYVRRYQKWMRDRPTHRSAPKWAQLLVDAQKQVQHYSKLLKLIDE